MKLYSAHRRNRKGEQGYILVVLLLAVALLAIAMGAAVTNYKKSIQRDKEVEAIHRGVQYARAIKRYYKKVGSYPNSVDQLINTNNIRFLRKKYSDPLSPDGKWRVLHQQDVKLFGTGGSIGLAPSSGMPNIPGVSGSDSTLLGAGGANNPSGGFSLFGGSSQNSGTSSQGGNSQQQIGGAIETTGGTAQGSSSGSVFSSGQNVMGGGPIIGVASLRNENGIHSFNQKTNYRDWQFIFNPQTDTERLITGPYNPNAFSKGGAGNTGTVSSSATGSTGTAPGTSQSGFSLNFNNQNNAPNTPSVQGVPSTQQ